MLTFFLFLKELVLLRSVLARFWLLSGAEEEAREWFGQRWSRAFHGVIPLPPAGLFFFSVRSRPSPATRPLTVPVAAAHPRRRDFFGALLMEPFWHF